MYFKRKYYLYIIVIFIIVGIVGILFIKNEQKKKEEISFINSIIMKDNDYKYDKLSTKIFKRIIPDLRNYLTDKEIINLFNNINSIKYVPYDSNNPNKNLYNRAFNSSGNITINLKESENENNYNELVPLLTHEILHSLGDFKDEKLGLNDYDYYYNRNYLLEEGMSYIVSQEITNYIEFTSLVLYEKEPFMMFMLDNDLNINKRTNRAYSIGYNVAYKIKALGCFDALINSNINGNFKSLKSCFNKLYDISDVNNFFDLVDKIFLYIIYPNKILTNEEVEIIYDMKIDNIYDLLFDLENTTINMLSNYYKNNRNINIKKELNNYEKNGLIYYKKDNIFINESYDKLKGNY